MNAWDELKKSNKENVNHMFDLLNRVGNEHDYAVALIETMRQTHPTLIQNYFRIIAQAIQEYATREYWDKRNEASIAWAKEVSKIDSYFPYI